MLIKLIGKGVNHVVGTDLRYGPIRTRDQRIKRFQIVFEQFLRC